LGIIPDFLFYLCNKNKNKFILSPYKYQDRYPVFNYYVYDNYKLYGTLASKKQGYSYFDYENSEFIEEEEAVENYKISDIKCQIVFRVLFIFLINY
jgi:hypothetical protein